MSRLLLYHFGFNIIYIFQKTKREYIKGKNREIVRGYDDDKLAFLKPMEILILKVEATAVCHSDNAL